LVVIIVDDLRDEAFVAARAHDLDEIVDRRQTFLAGERGKPAFQQVHLVGGEDDARTLAQ